MPMSTDGTRLHGTRRPETLSDGTQTDSRQEDRHQGGGGGAGWGIRKRAHCPARLQAAVELPPKRMTKGSRVGGAGIGVWLS